MFQMEEVEQAPVEEELVVHGADAASSLGIVALLERIESMASEISDPFPAEVVEAPWPSC